MRTASGAHMHGHYARVKDGGLYKGRTENDQSYMLCRITRSSSPGSFSPLALSENGVRALAGPSAAKASKPDSMEICFIRKAITRPGPKYAAKRPSRKPHLSRRNHRDAPRIPRYTLASARPRFAAGKRVYVSKKPAANGWLSRTGSGFIPEYDRPEHELARMPPRETVFLRRPGPSFPHRLSRRGRAGRRRSEHHLRCAGARPYPRPVRRALRRRPAPRRRLNCLTLEKEGIPFLFLSIAAFCIVPGPKNPVDNTGKTVYSTVLIRLIQFCFVRR